MSTGNITTLYNIQQLQDMEKTQQSKLEALVLENNKTPQASFQERRDDIVKQINQLSIMRTNLYATIPPKYKQSKLDAESTYSSLKEKQDLVDMAEAELNQVKTNMNEHDTGLNNKMRMVEINTYYSKKYKAYSNLVYLLIIITLPILVLTILRKRDIIPSAIVDTITAIIIAFGGYFVLRMVYDLMWRDNMNFDEYNWWFSPTASDPTVYQYDKNQLEGTDIGDAISEDANALIKNLGMGCFGEGCCSAQTVYNKSLGKCVLPKKDQTEGFEERKLNYVLTESINCPGQHSDADVLAFNSAETYSHVN
jgi:hypothetical protein